MASPITPSNHYVLRFNEGSMVKALKDLVLIPLGVLQTMIKWIGDGWGLVPIFFVIAMIAYYGNWFPNKF